MSDEPPNESSSDAGPSAIVQEAACAEGVAVLKVRVPGRTSLLLVGATRSGTGGAGLVTNDERRALWGGRLPPGKDRMRTREDALEGARVLAVGPSAVFIDQHGAARVIRADGTRVVVTDEAAPAGLPRFVELTDDARVALEARGLSLARALADDALDARRADIGRLLERAEQRIARRRDAVRGDLEKIAQADRIAAQASWLVAEAGRAPRGATKLSVTDWSTGEPVSLEVPLDPSKSAKEQVAAMFKRAKRLRLGARIAQERLEQAEGHLASVQSARKDVAHAPTLADVEAALLRAKRAAPRDVALPSSAGASPAKAKAKTAQGRTPYRAFFARSGRRLLVGKGAGDNDALTLHVARPRDLWLHAKDRTGAHVVVPLEKGQTCPADDLVDAAHLAAHFSDAREEKVVDVQYAERRHVRKPKGSPPGFVILDREKVLVLRVEPELLRPLLEREDV